MKKLFALVVLSLLLTSCSRPTQNEVEEKQKFCALDGREVTFSDGPFGGSLWCKYKESPLTARECINKYIESVYEKYNNPDTVSNLREDNYSQVVKTCNETFGEKSLSGSVKK